MAGFGVSIESLRPLSATDLDQLHWLLYRNWLSPILRKLIKHAPRTSHTNWLGATEHLLERGIQDGTLARSDRYLSFAPKTAEPLTERVIEHWTELAFVFLLESREDFERWFQAMGVRLTRPEAALADLLSRERPFVIIEAGSPKPFLVGLIRGGEQPELVVDEGVGPQSWDALSAIERERALAAWESGTCECFLCASLREGTSKKGAGKKAAKKPAKKAAKKAAKKPARKTEA